MVNGLTRAEWCTYWQNDLQIEQDGWSRDQLLVELKRVAEYLSKPVIRKTRLNGHDTILLELVDVYLHPDMIVSDFENVVALVHVGVAHKMRLGGFADGTFHFAQNTLLELWQPPRNLPNGKYIATDKILVFPSGKTYPFEELETMFVDFVRPRRGTWIVNRGEAKLEET